MHITRWLVPKSDWLYLCSQWWKSSIQSAKTRLGADCVSNHELLIAKFRLKLKKVGKSSRPFRYDLNQIPYDYIVEVTSRFKGLDLIKCLKNYGQKFITLYRKESESESCSLMSDSLWPYRLYSSWNSPGQNTRMGSLSFLPGIFPTQESNPGLPDCRRILYQLSHKGSPRILEWVAYSFSRGSSQPRNQTGVSCILGTFSPIWATREAQGSDQNHPPKKEMQKGERRRRPYK